MTAIAAVLALSATPSFAQVAEPVDTTASQPTAAPESSEPVITMDEQVGATASVVEPEVSATDAPAAAATTAKSKKASTAVRPSAKVAPSSPVSASTQAATASPAPPVADPVVTPTADPVAAADISAAAEEQSPPVVREGPNAPDSAELAFGGALAFITIGGFAYALTRRRRRSDDMSEADDFVPASRPVAAREPAFATRKVIQPSIERSAFAWGNAAKPLATSSRLTPSEQALRGPTADNPSMSLKKRLKRAHFFEAREREVADGNSVAVSRFAGLPRQMVDHARKAMESNFRQAQFQPA